MKLDIFYILLSCFVLHLQLSHVSDLWREVGSFLFDDFQKFLVKSEELLLVLPIFARPSIKFILHSQSACWRTWSTTSFAFLFHMTAASASTRNTSRRLYDQISWCLKTINLWVHLFKISCKKVHKSLRLLLRPSSLIETRRWNDQP